MNETNSHIPNAVNTPRYPKRPHEMSRYTDRHGRRWFMRAEYGPKTCHVVLTLGQGLVKVFGRLPFENGSHWVSVKNWIDQQAPQQG